jgi:CO/xanthine dehydrogenase FAD-binding subunit
MRGNPATHQFAAPGSLEAVLSLLASEAGEWMPFAGGTEIMVAHAAGRLRASKFVSLCGIPDLRFISTNESELSIGAATTFSEIRKSDSVAHDFPLLSRASSWIGAIANQSRATLGGNLVNASPAADSSPALLVYDAEIEMISVRGQRRIPYSCFHLGYKRTALAPDELLLAVHLPRRFTGHKQYLRKVGTRRAMAISKVALAVTALIEDNLIREIRIGAASLAAFPTRLRRTEDALLDVAITPETIAAAQAAFMCEASPIDDIRSTADYRRRVGANLLDEFLRSTASDGSST